MVQLMRFRLVLSSPPQTWQRDLLVDPQTSGGLLAAVAPEAAEQVVAAARAAGFGRAAVVGRLEAAGSAGEEGTVVVEA